MRLRPWDRPNTRLDRMATERGELKLAGGWSWCGNQADRRSAVATCGRTLAGTAPPVNAGRPGLQLPAGTLPLIMSRQGFSGVPTGADTGKARFAPCRLIPMVANLQRTILSPTGRQVESSNATRSRSARLDPVDRRPLAHSCCDPEEDFPSASSTGVGSPASWRPKSDLQASILSRHHENNPAL